MQKSFVAFFVSVGFSLMFKYIFASAPNIHGIEKLDRSQLRNNNFYKKEVGIKHGTCLAQHNFTIMQVMLGNVCLVDGISGLVFDSMRGA